QHAHAKSISTAATLHNDFHKQFRSQRQDTPKTFDFARKMPSPRIGHWWLRTPMTGHEAGPFSTARLESACVTNFFARACVCSTARASVAVALLSADGVSQDACRTFANLETQARSVILNPIGPRWPDKGGA